MRYLAAVLLASVLAAPSKPSQPVHKSPPAGRPRSLTILYTAAARGQIRSCNCTKFRYGGYGRELTLVKAIRRETGETILVEGGDTTGADGFQAELKAGLAAKALRMLGYSAMVPGDEELGVRGVSYIKRFTDAGAPIVCANLANADEHKTVFPAHVLHKTPSGLRVAIIGLLDPSVGASFLEREFGQTITSPADALKAELAAVRAKSDLVVVIYHGTPEDARKLVEIGGVNLIIATHRSGVDFTFRGKPESKVELPVATVGKTLVVNAETRANWNIGRIEINLTRQGSIASARHELIFLDRSYDEDPEMVAVYDDYNRQVKQAVLARSAEFVKTAEALLAKRGLNVADMRKRVHQSPFATAGACRDCHSQIYESWSASRHARAMASLQKTHQDFDPECVGCHVTGASVRNGFTDRSRTPELANVQCEACHGPARAHAQTPAKKPNKVGELTCRACHTDERTPDFDFEKAWAAIKH